MVLGKWVVFLSGSLRNLVAMSLPLEGPLWGLHWRGHDPSGGEIGVLRTESGRWLNDSLPEFMNFKLFGKTILVVIISLNIFWAIHSASVSRYWMDSRKDLKPTRMVYSISQGFG